MELQRVGVKFFCGDGASIDLEEFIAVFHRWIQTGALECLLIDVADYSHVEDGPGILLVAHEGIYAIDEGDGRRGLMYYQRQACGGSLAERLASVTRSALTACEKLVSEPEFAGRLSFRGDELDVFANDRLIAPNTPETLAAFEPSLADLLGKLYPDGNCELVPEPDARERFAVAVTAPAGPDAGALLQRLG